MWNSGRRERADQAIADRRRRVAGCIAVGLGVRETAAALGIGLATASRDRAAILREWSRERVAAIADHVVLELRRLDQAQRAIWTRVTEGDLDAIDRFLRISKSRRDLLGLDPPPVAKVETSGRRSAETHPPPFSWEELLERAYGDEGTFAHTA